MLDGLKKPMRSAVKMISNMLDESIRGAIPEGSDLLNRLPLLNPSG